MTALRPEVPFISEIFTFITKAGRGPRTGISFGGMKTQHPLYLYFRNNPSWMFAVVIALFSYILTQKAGSGEVAVMLRFLGSLSMISAPFIVLGYIWPSLSSRQKKINTGVVYGIIGTGILLLGPTLQDLPFTRYLSEEDSYENLYAPSVLIVTFLLLQLGVWWSENQNGSGTVLKWLQGVHLPILAVFVVLLCSIAITFSNDQVAERVQGYNEARRMGFYAGFTAQVFLVYFPYYLLYHIHHHVLFRGLFQQKGILYYLLGAVGLVMVYTILYGWLLTALPAVNDYFVHPSFLTKGMVNDVSLGMASSVLVLSLPFIIVVEWYRKERELTTLTTEKSAAELQLLKEQINPHFFFNTLNNLYAMSLTEHTATPDTILKLSNLMRYVIYRGRETTVALNEEVKYLQDYLDLQAIRLRQQLDLRFTVEIDDQELPVSPLLFVILVENAFKHGIEPDEKDCLLHLTLLAQDGEISFSCRNSLPRETPAPAPPGIGLVNLRRRLELLYPGRYEFSFRETDTDYFATLTLAS